MIFSNLLLKYGQFANKPIKYLTRKCLNYLCNIYYITPSIWLMKDQNTFFFFDYQLPPLFFYPHHLALRQRYNTIITNSTLCFIFIISLGTTSFSIINILFTYSLSPHSNSHSSLSDHHHRHHNYLQIHNVSNIYRFYRYICRLHF